MSKEKSRSTTIGLPGFVFLVLLTLKLAGIGEVAAWSWWAVTSPLWAPLVAILGFLAIALIIKIIIIALK